MTIESQVYQVPLASPTGAASCNETTSRLASVIADHLDLDDPCDAVLAELIDEIERMDHTIQNLEESARAQASRQRSMVLLKLHDLLEKRTRMPRNIVNEALWEVVSHTVKTFRAACIKMGIHEDPLDAAIHDCLPKLDEYVELAIDAVENGRLIGEMDSS